MKAEIKAKINYANVEYMILFFLPYLSAKIPLIKGPQTYPINIALPNIFKYSSFTPHLFLKIGNNKLHTKISQASPIRLKHIIKNEIH